MSGSLSGVTSAIGLGGAASTAAAALDGVLTVAAWRGVTFVMLGSADSAGTRALQFWFPGVDASQFQDLGALDGPIRVQGLIVGDDYVIRAGRMRRALLTPGTGTLIHPWWGELTCRLMSPGTIAFDDNARRVARFEAVFVREPNASTVTDTLSKLLDRADALVDSAQLAARQLLAPIALPLALIAAVTGMVSRVAGTFDGLVAAAPEAVQAAASGPLATLDAGFSVPASNGDTSYADSVVNGLVGVPAAIVSAVGTADSSAIASAQVAPVDTSTVDAATAATLLIAASAGIAGAAAAYASAGGASSGSALTLAAVARALTLSQAVAAASSIDYQSQDEAATWRDTVTAALDALADDLPAAIAGGAGVQALAGLWASLRGTRAAVVADISERLGRLPAVVDVVLPQQMSAWLVTYAVAGDTPGTALGVLTDLVARNQVAHPALVGPGTVAVLEQSA